MLPLTARAADAAGPAGAANTGGLSEAWLFVTVAFVVVAGMSYLAGRRQPPAGPGQAAPPETGVAAATPPTHPAPTTPTARPAEPAPSPLRRLAGTLSADPRPMLLLGTDPASGERRLLHANAAALRQLGLGADAIGQAWAVAEAAAPAALRTALAEPGAGGPWWLLRDEGGSLCLALGPEGNGAEADTASLVYTVSHDLRAPIRVVEGFTRIVKEDYGRQLDRVGNDHLDRVLGAAARMNLMIDALLTLARLSQQPLARQRVNLSQLASYVVDDLKRGAPERSCELTIEPGLAAWGDPTLLRLVLENLLGNAWKYTGKCRAPEVWLERRPQHPDTYTVRDNGAGFDMRFAERLFGVFQRLHSASDFQGTGIGLATVRRIVRRHGGEAWAEAEVDRGASFHFSLPPG